MEAQKIYLGKEMMRYLPLKIVTYTGNKGTVASILTDKRTGYIMALGIVESKTHGNIPVVWNIHGESTDRVSSRGLGDIKPTKDLCIKEILTEIPEESKETDIFKQAFDAISKANGVESENEKPKTKTKAQVVSLPEKIKNHLERLKDHVDGNVEVKAYMMDSDGNLVSIGDTESDIVH